MRDPIWVYDNWSAYTDGIYEEPLFGGVQDDTRLNEALALRELGEIVRLKRHGVRFDYYMMNAFWFDPDGAYRKWRQPDWPDGPDRWIEGCRENGLKPGLWFGSNSLWKINAAPQWRDSLAVKAPQSYLQSMSFYEGGFLADFVEVLEHWYDRGIRLFELDAAHFDVGTEKALRTQSREEIISRNQTALRDALQHFRARHHDVVLAAFNDFGGDIVSTATPWPFKKPVDLRWLEVFDTLYTGDTRVSDVPLINYWRSVDLFNDHMTRRYEQSGVPLGRCDPFFTLSTTWFGYHRETRAWRSMLLLAAARGSWKRTVYGALELLSDEDAQWLAKVQRIYAPLTAPGHTMTFGGIPGEIQPYGYHSFGADGAIYTVVNPTQSICAIELPLRSGSRLGAVTDGRILFRDEGFPPRLTRDTIELGPEQMAVVGFGRYALARYDLGIEPDVIIPRAIQPVPASFGDDGRNAVAASLIAPMEGDLRIVFCQRATDGSAPRSRCLKLEAEQAGKPLRLLQPDQHRAVSTGISWAAAEILGQDFERGRPLRIRCSSPEQRPIALKGNVYAIIV